jgi:hypothetical protein
MAYDNLPRAHFRSAEVALQAVAGSPPNRSSRMKACTRMHLPTTTGKISSNCLKSHLRRTKMSPKKIIISDGSVSPCSDFRTTKHRSKKTHAQKQAAPCAVSCENSIYSTRRDRKQNSERTRLVSLSIQSDKYSCI